MLRPHIPVTTGSRPELSLVIPVYNESHTIEDYLKDWAKCLDDAGVDYEMIVINDGSRDGTARILDNLRKELKTLRVLHQLNGGHSRAVRRGYEMSRGRYVLQVDAGGAYESIDFARFWEQKNSHTIVLGFRTHRLDSWVRRILAWGLKTTFKWAFSLKAEDPNIPFRLYRGDTLHSFLPLISKESRAVNILLSLYILRDCPQTVCELPVPYRSRSDGRSRTSTMGLVWYAFGVARELFFLKLREFFPRPQPIMAPSTT